MNPVALNDSVYLHFGTSSASTGAATDADSTPTVSVAEDGTALGYAPTVTNVATGLYKVQVDATAANGFEAGKRYSVYVTATVGGVTGRDGLAEFEVLGTDLNIGVASVISAVSITTGGVGSGAIDASELNNIADAVLDRNLGAGIDSGSSTVRTVRQALRASRNRVAISAGVATVYKEDDSTASWTAAISTAAGNPITEVDPAGP